MSNFTPILARAFITTSGLFFILFGIFGALQGFPLLAIFIIIGIFFLL